MNKICKVCLQSKLLSDFHAAKLGKYGFSARCKECIRQSYLKRTEGKFSRRNKQQLKRCSICSQSKPRTAFHYSNKQKGWIKGECKDCRTAKWNKDNPHTNRHWTPEYRHERQKANARKSYHRRATRNIEYFRLLNNQRRARLKGAKGSHTIIQWQQRIDYFNWQCAYCKIPLTVKTVTKDHKIPLVKGGSNWPANLVPACHRCNSGKGAKNYGEFTRNKATLRALS